MARFLLRMNPEAYLVPQGDAVDAATAGPLILGRQTQSGGNRSYGINRVT